MTFPKLSQKNCHYCGGCGKVRRRDSITPTQDSVTINKLYKDCPECYGSGIINILENKKESEKDETF